MPSSFTQQVVGLVTQHQVVPAAKLPFVRQAFTDTLAVTYAGWAEPVVKALLEEYSEATVAGPHSNPNISAEELTLVLGSAGHALDYDDVHAASITHPSIPIVAALTAAGLKNPERKRRMTTSFAVGLAVNIGLGQVLGYSHYAKGWHATSTLGPIAASAALAHFYGLNAQQTAWALAIVAAQCGGLQRNFGAMAKPLQAGQAAASAMRATRLARRGVTADGDVFAEKGYFDLYGGESFEVNPDDIRLDLYGGGISVKLYPCCYNQHRPIAAALEARSQLQELGVSLADLQTIEVVGPQGAFTALRVKHPSTGLQGKFCGEYGVSCALVDGEVTLESFLDSAVKRADLQRVLAKVDVREDAANNPPEGAGERARNGIVRLRATDKTGKEVLCVERTTNPGSPQDPPNRKQLLAKNKDCLAFYQHTTQRGDFDYPAFERFVDNLLGEAA